VFNPECGSRINEIPEKMPNFCMLNDGDILLSLTGNVGRVCLVFDGPFLLNQRVSKLLPLEESDKAMIYCMFREPSMLARLEQISNGVAQQNLSPIVAAKMEYIHPPEDLRQQFGSLAQPLINGIVQLNSTIKNLRLSRDLLLPRLLSGQINVEETAS
jgi:type I restriction enzyme S subunit